MFPLKNLARKGLNRWYFHFRCTMPVPQVPVRTRPPAPHNLRHMTSPVHVWGATPAPSVTRISMIVSAMSARASVWTVSRHTAVSAPWVSKQTLCCSFFVNPCAECLLSNIKDILAFSVISQHMEWHKELKSFLVEEEDYCLRKINGSINQSTLVQVMATSHYLSQCWPRSLSSYGITRPQWVNKDSFIFQGQ